MKRLGRWFLFLDQTYTRIKCKVFSVLVSGAFAHFGRRTMLMRPIRLAGTERISIGDQVFIGPGSWLQSLPAETGTCIAISIGKGVSIAGACVISAVQSIILEDDVLLARNVYISDHMHKFTDIGVPILAQGVDRISPVLIKRGAWLGQNVVVCPGVTIGEGSVVGANSVVTRNVPAFSVAVGAPAQVVKSRSPLAQVS